MVSFRISVSMYSESYSEIEQKLKRSDLKWWKEESSSPQRRVDNEFRESAIFEFVFGSKSEKVAQVV